MNLECDFISVIAKQEVKVDKAENTGVRMVGWASWQASELLFEGENGSGYSTLVIRLRQYHPSHIASSVRNTYLR